MNAKPALPLALAALLAAGTTKGATLKGTVSTNDRDGIEARITVLRVSGGVDLETWDTEKDGSFSIEVSATGLVAVATSAPEYASHVVDLSNGIPSGSLRFVLSPLVTATGTVLDSSGDGAAGAEVRVRAPDSTRSIHLDYGREAVTDDNGSFTVSIPSGSGRFVVDVEAEGWVPQSSNVLGSGAVASTGAGDGGPLSSIRIALGVERTRVSGKVTAPTGSLSRTLPCWLG